MKSFEKNTPFRLSVVVIGRNEEERLARCLGSVQAMRGDFRKPEIIYVDSASTDKSVERAQELGIKVVILEGENLSAAKARNAGWRAASSEYILFLDGDTVLDPDFVEGAREFLNDSRVAVVWGHRRELYPEKSIYNRVCDLDWIYPAGATEFFGGDALVRRKALEDAGGYNETLKAGEEPELGGRISRLGLKILHIDLPMTKHDLNMTTWKQYWRRAVRSGYAYAEVLHRFPDNAPKSFLLKYKTTFFHCFIGLGSLILAVGGMVVYKTFMFLIIWVAGALVMIIRSALRARLKTEDPLLRFLYAFYSQFIKIPLAIGQLSYWMHQECRRKGEP